MKIMQAFNRYLERGGEESSVHRIEKTLSARHVVFPCYFDSHEIGELHGWTAKAKAAIRMVWNTTSAEKVRSLARSTHADVAVLHNLFPIGSLSILQTAWKLKLPTIWYIHNFRPFSVNGYLWANDRLQPAGLKKNFIPEILAGSWQDSMLRTTVYATILRGMHSLRMFDRISAWIAISDFMRDKFIEAGIPADKIFTIRHSWSPMPVPPPPEDGGYYLFLGRLISPKGVDMLFSAWERIETELRDQAPLLVIAGEGPMAMEVMKRANGSRTIQFAGRVDGDEKAKLLRRCRAVIAPSIWWEPLGLVTYEAYDNGKPMLASRSGGLSETVNHGVTGMLHDPGNAEELASQVIELDAQPHLRVEMGKRGRTWLLANTSSETWLDQMDVVLNYVRKCGTHAL